MAYTHLSSPFPNRLKINPMKKILMMLGAMALIMLGVFSCQKTIDQNTDRDTVNAMVTLPADCVGPYTITLVSKTMQADGWHWVWRIVNPNEGNGIDPGTVQALSHFNLLVPVCEPAIEVTYAGYSTDGLNFNSVSTTPVLDNSYKANCDRDDLANTPAIKFDYGGDYYFKLVVTDNYQPGVMYGMYKSGDKTGCGMTCFEGISCLIDNPPPPEGCSFSQGFWFAKPISEENAWPAVFTMGGHEYTQAEGKALFFVSGNIELKRAFTQAATIKLSMASGFLTDPSAIMPTVNYIEAVLSGLPKLTPANIANLNKGLTAAQRKNLGNWAGYIGNYVDAHHCEMNPPQY
jgi:hypothetical protein